MVVGEGLGSSLGGVFAELAVGRAGRGRVGCLFKVWWTLRKSRAELLRVGKVMLEDAKIKDGRMTYDG